MVVKSKLSTLALMALPAPGKFTHPVGFAGGACSCRFDPKVVFDNSGAVPLRPPLLALFRARPLTKTPSRRIHAKVHSIIAALRKGSDTTEDENRVRQMRAVLEVLQAQRRNLVQSDCDLLIK